MSETVTIENVELIRSGSWTDASGKTVHVSPERVKAMFANSQKLGFRPPLKLGHSDQGEFQKSLKESSGIEFPSDGLPALGFTIPRVVNQNSDGSVSLMGDLERVPKKSEGLIKNHFRNRSAEILSIPDGKGGQIADVFGGLALLGMTRPAIKQLAASYSEFNPEFPVMSFAEGDVTVEAFAMTDEERQGKREKQPPWSEANPVGKLKPEEIPDHVFAYVPKDGPPSGRMYPYKWKSPNGWEVHVAGLQAALQRASQHGLEKYPGVRATLEKASRQVGFSEDLITILGECPDLEPPESGNETKTTEDDYMSNGIRIIHGNKERILKSEADIKAFSEDIRQEALKDYVPKTQLEELLKRDKERAKEAHDTKVKTIFTHLREPDANKKALPPAVVDLFERVALAAPHDGEGVVTIEFSEDGKKSNLSVAETLAKGLEMFRSCGGLINFQEEAGSGKRTGQSAKEKELRKEFKELKEAGIFSEKETTEDEYVSMNIGK